MKGSCAMFGVPVERCLAMNAKDLQDSSTKWWPSDLIIDLVDKQVQLWNIDTVKKEDVIQRSDAYLIFLTFCYKLLLLFQIITFDEGGISGHINHRAVSAAMR